MKNTFSPIATLTYNDLIYFQVFPAPAHVHPSGEIVEMVEIRIQNTDGVYFTEPKWHQEPRTKSRFLSVAKLAKGYHATFFLPLGKQTIVRSCELKLEMSAERRQSYDSQLR